MIGVFGLLAGLAFVTVALFVLDWLLELTVALRVVLFALAAGLAVAAARRYVLPWFAGLESELDLALLVQRHFGIDSDLVAALQFERPEAVQWGSVELEQTVIRHVASQAEKLPLIEDVPRAPLKKRVLASICGVALIVGLVALFPEHVAIFTKRLLLHDVSYPTATRVDEVSVNGCFIAWDQPGQELRCKANGTVDILVITSGKIPKAGQAVFRTVNDRRELRIPLVPTENHSNKSVLPSQKVFSGKLNGLNQVCRLRMVLGDTTSQWVDLAIVPPPVVLTWFAYQDGLSSDTSHNKPEIAFGKTQVSVRQGTRVVVGLAAKSKLQPVTAALGELEVPLQRGIPRELETRFFEILRNNPGDPKGMSTRENEKNDTPLEIWWLDPTQTPLEKTEYPVRIRFTVRDQFGLEPAAPVEAFVSVRPDYPPQIEARTITRLVLPSAQPSVYVDARDDVGLREIRVLGKLIRADGEEGPTCQWVLWQSKGDSIRVLNDKYKVDLQPLQAKKGDKIELVVVAEDDRGSDQSGVAAHTDAILMEVTDLAGILAVMAEADRESAAQLQEMINYQLDVGGGQ